MQRCARIWATDGQSELHIAAPPALVSVQLKETRRGSLPRRIFDAGAVPCTEKPAEYARVFTVTAYPKLQLYHFHCLLS